MNKRKTKNGKRAVIVTTVHRGVFFGYATKTTGKTIALTGARNCLYWDKSIGGFLGLASMGPNSKCRIGARADGELRDITAVIECTAEAVKAWESAPCGS